MVERELDVNPHDFRRWVCLHEETHRTQFTSVPWLRPYVQEQMSEFLLASDLDPASILERIRAAADAVAGAVRGGDGESLIEAIQSPRQRAILDRMTSVMTVVEGHGDYVMDAVGPAVVPSVAEIRAKFSARRGSAGRIEQAIRRVLGIDLKMKQYEQGSRFVKAVVDEAGMATFNKVWTSPDTLPTKDELQNPQSWLARVDGAYPAATPADSGAIESGTVDSGTAIQHGRFRHGRFRHGRFRHWGLRSPVGPHPAVAEVRRAVRASLADLEPGTAVLAACSGGADSLALAAALAFEAPKAGLLAGGITVDHGLQPGSADQAKRVTADLDGLGLSPVISVAVTVARPEEPGYPGPEAAARSARYAALDLAAERTDSWLFLGHTLDDQAETVLLGLGRGSGPRSLAGMASVSGRYRRPLLGLRRSETMAACAAQGLQVWDDPQNNDPAFTRVRVRRLMPALEEALGPGVAEALARTATLLRADAEVLDALAAAEADRLGGLGDAQVSGWRADWLAGLPLAIRQRVLRSAALAAGCPAGALSQRHMTSLDELVTGWHGQRWIDLPGGARCQRRYGKLLFTSTRGPGVVPRDGTVGGPGVVRRDGTVGGPGVVRRDGTVGGPGVVRRDGTVGGPGVVPRDGTVGGPGVVPRDGTVGGLAARSEDAGGRERHGPGPQRGTDYPGATAAASG